MLPAHIIERIRQREARQREQQQPSLTLELPVPQWQPRLPEAEAEENRGVVIIQL